MGAPEPCQWERGEFGEEFGIGGWSLRGGLRNGRKRSEIGKVRTVRGGWEDFWGPR